MSETQEELKRRLAAEAKVKPVNRVAEVADTLSNGAVAVANLAVNPAGPLIAFDNMLPSIDIATNVDEVAAAGFGLGQKVFDGLVSKVTGKPVDSSPVVINENEPSHGLLGFLGLTNKGPER